MSMAKPGLIQDYCIPNAILTFKEYLLDYATDDTIKSGNAVIEKELEKLEKISPKLRSTVEKKLKLIEKGQRDLYL